MENKCLNIRHIIFYLISSKLKYFLLAHKKDTATLRLYLEIYSMISPQFSIRIPPELEQRLMGYAKQNGMSKTKVMIDALAHYLGCAEDVPLIRRVTQLEERVSVLEAERTGK